VLPREQSGTWRARIRADAPIEGEVHLQTDEPLALTRTIAAVLAVVGVAISVRLEIGGASYDDGPQVVAVRRIVSRPGIGE
jgi:hypothetical protein